jgi:hypothetical protein
VRPDRVSVPSRAILNGDYPQDTVRQFFHRTSGSLAISALMMEATGTSETSVNF